MEKATIDILPKCLIEKIISYLSFEDAAKMSILSKTWLRSRFTHPNIEFTYPYSRRNLELMDTIMNRYTEEKIPIDNGVTNCNSLRKLSPTRVKLEEDMLQTLLNCCPLINLKSLDISHTKICDGFLHNIISALKDLKIQFCKGEEEIDSSNLESLEYMGYKIPKLKIARQLKHLKINHYCSGSLKTAWFYNLRKFLSNSTSCPQVSLWFSQCNEINLTDLQLHHGVATPKVDVLNVNCTWRNGECPTFLDALLWSCHPRRGNIISTSATFKCFINRLIYMKNLCQYSPWHGQLELKGAQVYIFDDNTRRVGFL
ncbi:hypothetical protein R3W88_012230 [Solanum pinnatisectum]|uniref:F-box domain-containing protein n=1 Tax=Solanum pinnatisectum TaxID=50273 RepID=A0AAV9L9Q0_9SOLN|nr:hypothetical protein R3W88_012230 [Solanum pinnatisectum]